jgi:hypothetical protein
MPVSRSIRLKLAAPIAALCLLPSSAHAGAWTLEAGKGQIIMATIISRASKGFGAHGRPTQDVVFRKSFASAYAEYGWNDWLTLIAVPEYASATSSTAGDAVEGAKSFAFSGGVRARLLDGSNVLSLQAMARSAGAFEQDTSFQKKAGEEFELRALYGTHFEIFGREGCFDAEVAQRWATGGRPDETPIDLTVMYDIGWQSQVLLQNFNVISEGRGKPPFEYYRYHKTAFSVVRPVWRTTSLQLGVFASPAGQNALVEKGIFLAVWTKF